MATINVSQLGVKARSKHEMYRLLTVEAKIYLPPQKECSIYFIRDIFHGQKKVNRDQFFTFALGIVCRRSKSEGCSSNQ